MEDISGLRGGQNHAPTATLATVSPTYSGRVTAGFRIKGTQPWPKSPKVRCLIRILRNALAHNNIVAFGDNVNEIKKLGFFSEKKTKTGNNCTTKDGYLVLVIDTTAFQTFLKAWFDVIAPQTDSANDEQP
jgi:hypothetical protein